MDDPSPNYWDYLKLDRMLNLQGGLEDDESKLMSDELHFIVVHQVFELWFKLVLRELRLARDHLSEPRVPEETVPHVVHHLRRVNEIFRLAVDQFRVMETLTPQDFLAFRDKLIPASGFQSFQMREIEILLGLEDGKRVSLGEVDTFEHLKGLASTSKGGEFAWGRITQARSETTLLAALREWLYRTPIQGSQPADKDDESVVDTFLHDYLDLYRSRMREQMEMLKRRGVGTGEELDKKGEEADEVARGFFNGDDLDPEHRRYAKRARAGLLFIESYRALPLLAWPRTLVDTIVELEELLVLWRHRHARMVERTIGRRVGTGGSSGVDYLDSTARYRVFKDLWAVRTLLLPKEHLPPLLYPERYGFARVAIMIDLHSAESLSGKHALVCGASAGIGKAVGQALAARGAKLSLLARSRDKLEALVEDLSQSGAPEVIPLVADMDQRDALGKTIEGWLEEHGPAHILINNSGGPSPGPILEAEEQAFLDGFSRHVLVAHGLVRRLLPGMRDAGYGRIINVISTSVREPIAGLGVSNTIRAAMAGWAKTVSKELPPGVTINNVLPGFTATERLFSLRASVAKRTEKSEEDVEKGWLAMIPEGRLGQPEEIAAAIAFLASPSAAYIRGISLPVEGGRMQSL